MSFTYLAWGVSQYSYIYINWSLVDWMQEIINISRQLLNQTGDIYMTNCTVKDCEGKLYGNTGYCSKHYQRMYRHGTLVPLVDCEHLELCSMDGCNNRYYAKGVCAKHYKKTDEYVLYTAWRNMHQRCENPIYNYYKDYGSRGIVVCKRWSGEYGLSNFLADMGSKPTSKHTLDRKNNDGNYSPNNCKWSTPTEQNLNRRVQSNNTSGVSGVGWDKRSGKWRVRVQSYGTVKEVGLFITRDEAILMRKKAEKLL